MAPEPKLENQTDTYARAHELKEIAIGIGRSNYSRSEALSDFLLDFESRSTIPDDLFKDLMEIVWNYVSADHVAFEGEDVILMSSLSHLQTKWSPRQRGILLSLRRCIRKGSFVVFWACQEGRTNEQYERLIDEARWSKIRKIVEEIESIWHA